MLTSLTRACRRVNDQMTLRLPIHQAMLYVILDQVAVLYAEQPYLKTLYQALLSTMYFGMFRIGELAYSHHVVKVVDVHIAVNKKKILFILRSSKTHDAGGHPQKIKIASAAIVRTARKTNTGASKKYCPYQLLKQYLVVRGRYYDINEQFFTFADLSPVHPSNVRSCLQKSLKLAGFQSINYSVHSLRVGCGGDLLKYGISVETIKKLGWWRSNSVFAYLRNH